MRKFFLSAAVITLALFLLGFAGLSWTARGAAFRPGDALFPLQHLAERQAAGRIREPLARVEFEISLLERRLGDLEARTGSRHETAAVRYLDRAVDHTALALSVLDGASLDGLRGSLVSLVGRIQAALGRLVIQPVENPEPLRALQTKVATLAALLSDPLAQGADFEALARIAPQFAPLSRGEPNPAALSSGGTSPVDPRGVPFPPGSINHDFYPLVGEHAAIACESCHVDNIYAGTPTQCIACHAEDLPADHYAGDCASCHVATTWQDVNFDHSGQTNCAACHTDDAPANHYTGQCSDCHVTGSWSNVSFNHSGQTNCLSCHTDDAPANHYAGQCSACHNTSGWEDVSFNHSGQTNCLSCHTDDAPANHYAGQCSACHNTSNWSNVSFNHSGQTNCAACHAAEAPPNHFSGQCSDCHDVDDNWDFAHNSGGLNCLACHAGEEPDDEDHPIGQQCSDCHNTQDWDEVNDKSGREAAEQFFHAAIIPVTQNGFLDTLEKAADCSSCHGD